MKIKLWPLLLINIILLLGSILIYKKIDKKEYPRWSTGVKTIIWGLAIVLTILIIIIMIPMLFFGGMKDGTDGDNPGFFGKLKMVLT